MAAMTALFGFAGIMLGGFEGLLIAIILAIMMNLFAWYNSDKMVLRMYGAKKVPQEHPLCEMVANLSLNAQLPMPKVYEIQVTSLMRLQLAVTLKTPQSLQLQDF